MSIYRVWKNDPNRARLSAYKYHLKKGDLVSQTKYDNLRRGRKPPRKPCTLSDAQILKKWKGWLTAAAIIFVVVMCCMN